MFRFLRKTMLWILLLPAATWMAGFSSNQAVLIANHGKFPVRYNNVQIAKWYAEQESKEAAILAGVDPTDDDDVREAQAETYIIEAGIKNGMLDPIHCLMTSKTHLNFLADTFNLGPIYSVGDGLLFAAEWSCDYFIVLWMFMASAKLMRQEE